MTDSETVAIVRDFLAREFPKHAAAIAAAAPDASLVDLGLLDSLGLLTLVTFVELRWSIKVSPKDFRADAFRSLRQIEATLERYR